MKIKYLILYLKTRINEIKHIFDSTIESGILEVPPNSQLVAINRLLLQKFKN